MCQFVGLSVPPGWCTWWEMEGKTRFYDPKKNFFGVTTPRKISGGNFFRPLEKFQLGIFYGTINFASRAKFWRAKRAMWEFYTYFFCQKKFQLFWSKWNLLFNFTPSPLLLYNVINSLHGAQISTEI